MDLYESFTDLTNNSRRNISKAEIRIRHITTVNFPQAYPKAVNITSSVVWLTIKNLTSQSHNQFQENPKEKEDVMFLSVLYYTSGAMYPRVPVSPVMSFGF
ncbi:hypothetical protein F2Q70_00036708 [Brassica cretica]|uniref:Uncharacterized protein n=1 Tax=Brassica cretica TaxID=69181 RepID=A0A8S9JZD5_BRACR|nr:hypothetical protein F2Q70_00036708 [Brassica cretica]